MLALNFAASSTKAVPPLEFKISSIKYEGESHSPKTALQGGKCGPGMSWGTLQADPKEEKENPS